MMRREGTREITSMNFSKKHINSVSRSTGLPPSEAINLMSSFIRQYQGNVPSVIRAIPVIIYNGKWINSYEKFIEEVGLKPKEVKKFMQVNNIHDELQAVQQMSSQLQDVCYDLRTGKTGDIGIFVLKYRTPIPELIAKGMVVMKSVKMYPSTYKPTGYCARPLLDFRHYLATL